MLHEHPVNATAKTSPYRPTYHADTRSRRQKRHRLNRQKVSKWPDLLCTWTHGSTSPVANQNQQTMTGYFHPWTQPPPNDLNGFTSPFFCYSAACSIQMSIYWTDVDYLILFLTTTRTLSPHTSGCVTHQRVCRHSLDLHPDNTCVRVWPPQLPASLSTVRPKISPGHI